MTISIRVRKTILLPRYLKYYKCYLKKYCLTSGEESKEYFTAYYVDLNQKTLKDVLKNEVEKRIDEKLYEYEETGLKLDEKQKAEIKDSIFNMIDRKMYTNELDFQDDSTKRAYDKVVLDMYNELKGTSRDIYGAFSGNTFNYNEEDENKDVERGGFHDAIRNRTDKIDKNGEKVPDYRVYWLSKADEKSEKPGAGINEDGTGFYIRLDNGEIFREKYKMDKNLKYSDSTLAQDVINSDGNIVYSDLVSMEFFAETMASGITREVGSEFTARNYYYSETMDYFDELVVGARELCEK